MRLTFFANACSIVEHAGFRILTDPWLSEGAFEGSWFHTAPLRTTPADVAGVDALFISHLHPDHFDVATLSVFRRDIPIVHLDHGANFLRKRLASLGFHNLIGVRDRASVTIGPFECTLFAPFAKHPFHDSILGNMLDSAILFRAGDETILNTNDNMLTPAAARRLREEVGRITVAQLNYNAAGPFPSCFDHLSLEDKRARHRSLLERNLGHLIDVARELQPEIVMPFAGEFVVGGNLWRKNEVLGSTTCDEAAAAIDRAEIGVQSLLLNEGMTFDLTARVLVDGPYRPVDVVAQAHYVEHVLSRVRFSYEADDTAGIDEDIAALLPIARRQLWRKQQQFAVAPALHVYIKLADRYFQIDMSRDEGTFVPLESELRQPYLECAMDQRLLRRILTGRAHWNNAEVGCHVSFRRVPDTYLPDVHTILSFLHVPPPSPQPSTEPRPAAALQPGG